MAESNGGQPGSHPQIYRELHDSEEFTELRSRYRGFVFPWTVVFLVWYLLFVCMSNWAPGFMDIHVFGHVNMALVFGLLQFASTFLIAWLYARHMNRKADPLSHELLQRYEAAMAEARAGEETR